MLDDVVAKFAVLRCHEAGETKEVVAVISGMRRIGRDGFKRDGGGDEEGAPANAGRCGDGLQLWQPVAVVGKDTESLAGPAGILSNDRLLVILGRMF